jgi:predicted hydrocarbon binding protein
MKKAQSILEYAVLTACFIAALVGMQIYLKRGIEGRLKATADDLGRQYAPKNTLSETTITFSSQTITEVKSGVKKDQDTGKEYDETTTTTTINETQTQQGDEIVG